MKTSNSISLNRRPINNKEMFRKFSLLRPINGESIFTVFLSFSSFIGYKVLSLTHVEFRVFTDYLLGQSNTTLIYDCFPSVSNTLPVAVKDMDGNTIIRLYNMRAGIDQNISSFDKAELGTFSRTTVQKTL